MKKFVAFLMAFALCVACFGTYGFADIACVDDSHDHDHDHEHVVHAADDDLVDDDIVVTEYLYLNRNQTTHSFNESTKKLTVTIMVDSESLEKGAGGVLKITAPYTQAIGKPTVVSGYVFGVAATSCDTVTTSTATPGTYSTSEIEFSVNNASFTQYAMVTIEYPIDTDYLAVYTWLRQAQFHVTGTVVTVSGKTVSFDPTTSSYTAYLCNHASVGERVTKEATCKSAGEKEIYCLVCGYIVESKTVLPTNHDLDYTKPFNTNQYPYVQPTCSSYGSGFFKCKDCGTLTTATVPKLEHKFGDRIIVNGVYYYVCSVCNTREVATNQCPHDADNYTLLSVVTSSTCSIKGVGRYQCPECKQIEERALPLASHTYSSSTTTTAATCTRAGVKTSVCSACRKSITESIPALGHAYGEWTTVKAATCVQNGQDARYCSRCSASETRTITGSGHDYGAWITTVPASCVSTGTSVRVCELCDQTQSQTIAMTAHTYGAWTTTTAATCVAAGVETHICTVCSASETRAINPIAENHKYGEWTTVIAKTCVTDGEKSRTCEYCSNVETEIDACTGHVLGDAVVSGKVSTKTCGVCGYKESTKTVKDGVEKTLSSASGSLSLVGTEASKNYTFELGVPSMETEAYYKQYQDFYKAYTFKVLVDGEEAPVNASMELAIATDPLLENYEISVLRLVGNSFYPVNNFDRKGDEVIIPGTELGEADVLFIVKGEESAPNLVIPIVVTIVTLVVAGAAIYIFMVKGKRKESF